jgi:hypothetical protein
VAETNPDRSAFFINAQLALSIYNSLRKLDTFADEQKIHFSAQDDSWESNYQHRLD